MRTLLSVILIIYGSFTIIHASREHRDCLEYKKNPKVIFIKKSGIGLSCITIGLCLLISADIGTILTMIFCCFCLVGLIIFMLSVMGGGTLSGRAGKIERVGNKYREIIRIRKYFDRQNDGHFSLSELSEMFDSFDEKFGDTYQYIVTSNSDIIHDKYLDALYSSMNMLTSQFRSYCFSGIRPLSIAETITRNQNFENIFCGLFSNVENDMENICICVRGEVENKTAKTEEIFLKELNNVICAADMLLSSNKNLAKETKVNLEDICRFASAIKTCPPEDDRTINRLSEYYLPQICSFLSLYQKLIDESNLFTAEQNTAMNKIELSIKDSADILRNVCSDARNDNNSDIDSETSVFRQKAEMDGML